MSDDNLDSETVKTLKARALLHDAPSHEELMENKPSSKEMLAGTEEAKEWYNDAVNVAANLIVEVAEANKEFRGVVQDPGSTFSHIVDQMSEYDERNCERVNSIGLSAFQAHQAQTIARAAISD